MSSINTNLPEPRLLTRQPNGAEDRAPETPPRKPALWLLIAGRSFPALVLLALIAILGGRYWTRAAMRAALPQIDGTLRVNGLAAPVTVQRDAHGVPHIRAASLDDLIFAQGYVTAQDRLWQMDALRRHASGSLAEVLGVSMLPHDRAQRLLQLRAIADSAVAALPPDQLHWLQVYTHGVNASIADQLPHLPIEFHILRYQPTQWAPRDSILVGLTMFQDLTTTFPGKLAREAITSKLSPDQIADLYPIGSWRDHPPTQQPVDLSAPRDEIEDVPLDESQSKLSTPNLLDSVRIRGIVEAQRILGSLCDGCTAGSNNWAVSGQRTASGKPLLANDMHLALAVPGIWYEADLEAPGPSGDFHAAGVTLPGAPFIIVGQNGHVAWSFTNMGADVQDLAIEHTRGSGDTAEFQTADGYWHPVIHHLEVIRVRNADDVTLDVDCTQHGSMITPVISPIFPHEKRALSLRWTVYNSPHLALPFFNIDSAADGQSLVHAFSTWGGPTENLIYADDQGHIGYHAIGRIPIRGPVTTPDATNTAATPGIIGSTLSPTPVDATDLAHQWSGAYIPFDSLPQTTDPSDGILATANARIAPDGYPFLITLDWGSPYRNQRIWKVLSTKTNLTPADMLELQNDIYSDLDLTIAHHLAYAIDHSVDVGHTLNPKRTRQAADILRTWNGSVDANAAAPAIVQAARAALWHLILQPQLGDLWLEYAWGEKDYAEEQLILHTPARWLPARFANWDDLLTAAVDRGLIDAHAPSDLTTWHEGNAHPVDIEHPLFGASPLLKSLIGKPTGTGAQPQSGDTTTVKQAGHSFGPSERFTADLADPDLSTLNVVLGESGNPASPFFMDQWPAWSTGKTFLLPFTTTAVSNATTHTLTLLPR